VVLARAIRADARRRWIVFTALDPEVGRRSPHEAGESLRDRSLFLVDFFRCARRGTGAGRHERAARRPEPPGRLCRRQRCGRYGNAGPHRGPSRGSREGRDAAAADARAMAATGHAAAGRRSGAGVAAHSELLPGEAINVRLGAWRSSRMPRPATSTACARRWRSTSRPIRVSVEVGSTAGAARQRPWPSTARSERQKNAEDAIYGDPFVQELIENFGAQVEPQSIRPRDRERNPQMMKTNWPG